MYQILKLTAMAIQTVLVVFIFIKVYFLSDSKKEPVVEPTTVDEETPASFTEATKDILNDIYEAIGNIHVYTKPMVDVMPPKSEELFTERVNRHVRDAQLAKESNTPRRTRRRPPKGSIRDNGAIGNNSAVRPLREAPRRKHFSELNQGD